MMPAGRLWTRPKSFCQMLNTLTIGDFRFRFRAVLSATDMIHSVRSILDSHRNSIMMLEVHYSVGMLSLATGTYIAGLYGMNLINGLEEAAHGFPIITGGSIVGIIGVAILGLHKLRRVRRMYNLHGIQYGRRNSKAEKTPEAE